MAIIFFSFISNLVPVLVVADIYGYTIAGRQAGHIRKTSVWDTAVAWQESSRLGFWSNECVLAGIEGLTT